MSMQIRRYTYRGQEGYTLVGRISNEPFSFARLSIFDTDREFLSRLRDAYKQGDKAEANRLMHEQWSVKHDHAHSREAAHD